MNRHYSRRRHYGIICQYRILNECLQLVSQSNLRSIKKLTIETKLIRMKKLLLNHRSPEEIRCSTCGGDLFEGLLSQLRAICRASREEAAVERTLERLRGVLALLAEEQATRKKEVDHEISSSLSALPADDAGSGPAVPVQG